MSEIETPILGLHSPAERPGHGPLFLAGSSVRAGRFFICLYPSRPHRSRELGSKRLEPLTTATSPSEHGTIINAFTSSVIENHYATPLSDVPVETVRLNGYGQFDSEVMRLELAVSSGLGNAVETLLFMLDWANGAGWTCISKVRIARGLHITERTVQRHWERARNLGYLRSFDYPAHARRTSDHWLIWPDLKVSSGDPGLDALADIWPANQNEPRAGEFICSPGFPPF